MFRTSPLLKCLAAAVALSGLLMLPARMAFADDQFSAAQKAAIEKMIKDYISKNPEVVRDALTELDLREKTAELDARNKIIGDPQGPLYVSDAQEIVGNPNGKITLVEFFDYNCGYCKKALGDIAQLIKANPDLRVILKDYPILTDESAAASTIALAVRKQFTGDKFWQYHQRLLSTRGMVGRDEALALAKDMGADMARLNKDAGGADIQNDLKDNLKLGQALMLSGTPSFVIGEEPTVGAIGYDAMKSKLDNVRKCGKVVCS